MPLLPIRPRNTRVGIDEVRDSLRKNPMVLKVIGRTFKDINMTLFRVDDIDIEFSRNFFYWNDTGAQTPTPVALLMVPFEFNGEE